MGLNIIIPTGDVYINRGVSYHVERTNQLRIREPVDGAWFVCLRDWVQHGRITSTYPERRIRPARDPCTHGLVNVF